MTRHKRRKLRELGESVNCYAQKHTYQLLEKILKFEPIKQGDERYIPYCDFQAHRGIAVRYRICEDRGCNYYKRLVLK